jgi:hypothetical protein
VASLRHRSYRGLFDQPTTLVEFHLADDGDGTSLTVIESGFDRIPPERGTTAFRVNDEGWGVQMENLSRYVGS